MPYKDEKRRRECAQLFKRKRRSEGWTKKWLDKRLTYIQVETAEDLRDLLNEVVTEMCDADITSLGLETKLKVTDAQ